MTHAVGVAGIALDRRSATPVSGWPEGITCRVWVDVCGHDRCTLVNEGFADGSADSATGTGHECDLAFEPPHSGTGPLSR